MIVEAFKDALELGLQKENQVVVSVASAIAEVVSRIGPRTNPNPSQSLMTFDCAWLTTPPASQ
jgi:hypothetical protein